MPKDSRITELSDDDDDVMHSAVSDIEVDETSAAAADGNGEDTADVPRVSEGKMVDESDDDDMAADAEAPAADDFVAGALPDNYVDGSVLEDDAFGDDDEDLIAEEDPSLSDFVRQETWTQQDMSMIFSLLARDQQKWIPEDQSDLLRKRISDVDLVSRAEEDAFLREPMSTEPACVEGAACQAMFMPGVEDPKPLMAHFTARQRADIASGKNVPPSMCIMCKRYTVMWMAIQARLENGNIEMPGSDTGETLVFHSHGNYVNQPGEYCLDQCVVTGRRETHGMIIPCVMHDRSCYKWSRGTDGLIRFTQDGYAFPPFQ